MAPTAAPTAISEYRICGAQAPDADELALLTPMKADLPPEVFTSVYQPPRSRGDGFDRANLLQADACLSRRAGC
jgi:ABC-type oligopeptide transport system substrate-binding subunit